MNTNEQIQAAIENLLKDVSAFDKVVIVCKALGWGDNVTDGNMFNIDPNTPAFIVGMGCKWYDPDHDDDDDHDHISKALVTKVNGEVVSIDILNEDNEKIGEAEVPARELGH